MLIMIEGNIGAGKSTFLKVLKNHLDANIIFEPTNKWQNLDPDNNLLDLFYKDTPRWAYTFQSYAFVSRVQTILEYQKKLSSNNDTQFLERSIYCDRYCFAKNCFESGFMKKIEWEIYKEWFAWLAENYAPRPSGFIYLRTNPETCYKRILKRSRSEECDISMGYLESLHKRHEDWLIHKKDVINHLKTTPILTLDCNEEFENNIPVQKEHILKIKEFMEKEVLKTIIPVQEAAQKVLSV